MSKGFAAHFPFFPERWLASVALLSDGEQIAVLRLLCYAWLMDGLPVEVSALSRLAGRKVTPPVLEKFPVAPDGKRRSPFMEEQRAKQIEGIAKRVLGANITNAKRLAKRGAEQDAERHAQSAAGDSLPLSIIQAHTHTQAVGPSEAEFPSWFPATVDKAVAMCASFPVPPDYVRMVWHQLVGREFKDGAGNDVTRFAHHIAGRWPKERTSWERDQNAKGSAKQRPQSKPEMPL